MTGFKQIEGDFAIVVERGVYKQCDLYSRNGYLFAKVGGGFVRLSRDGSSSKTSIRLETLSYEGKIYTDPMGRLCTEDASHPSKALLSGEASTRLLGGPESG